MWLRRALTAAIITLTLGGLLIALPAPVVRAAPAFPAGFLLQDIVTGLRPPNDGDPGDLITDFAFLPDESLLVTGKYGKVMWAPRAGTPRQIATLPVIGDQDLGLVGLAVSPNYADDHIVYTASTAPSTGPTAGAFGELRLTQWTVTVDGEGTPTGLTDERVLLAMSSDADVHGMTGVVAAADGTLWVSVGDSARWQDFDQRAFRATNWDDPHGKVYHLRADGSGVPSNPYYDPADPTSVRSKVYASGFRSPFRLSLDPVSGRPIVGDVGWNTYEEVNLIEPGNNYGWPCWEGREPTPTYRDMPECDDATTVAPLWAYSRDMGGRSVTGGVVYTGTSYPAEYQGRYFFGDYHGRRLWTMAFDQRGVLTLPPETNGLGQDVGAPVKFATMPSGGDIVFADIGAATIRRLVYAPGNNPPVAVTTATGDPETMTMTLDATNSYDPNGDVLTYQWDFGDGSTGTGKTVTHTYAATPDNFTVTLTATDPLGASATSTVVVYPANHAPELTLTGPAPDQLFSVGDVITADATTSDTEDGALSVWWATNVAHCAGVGNCHDHPGQRQDGPHFQMTFDGHPGDTRLEITAIATDSRGATTTRTFEAKPRQRRVTVQSSTPAGFVVGSEQTNSSLFTVGQQITIVAPETAGDGVATFERWADDAPRVRNLTMPDADVALDVSYLTPIDRRYAADAALRATVGTPVAVEQGDISVRWREFTGGYVYWSPQTDVHEVHGAILASYLNAGSHLMFGVPSTDELSTPDGRGRYALFTGDRAIYWTEQTWSHTIAGEIYLAWRALGGEAGPLGYPTTDGTGTPDGQGRFNHFEGGSVYWHPDTGAYEVRGAIKGVWSAMGWEKSVLGYPRTNELSTVDTVGRYNDFQGGSVYWHPDTGAHEIHGLILARWTELGLERSVLGYPTTNEAATPDGVGRYNHFQAGSVYWHPNTGAYELHGSIKAVWAQLGWEKSVLGYPTTNETATPDGVGRYNHFQGGSIYWHPAAGAHEVHGAILGRWVALGWERSYLGYPTSNEFTVSGGKRSNFEHGYIVWDAATGQVTDVRY
jgi:uncharacterized protein with LGFP repeats/glucose/arabinose dehydrogenase